MNNINVWEKRRSEIARELEEMKGAVLQYQLEAGQNRDWSLAEQLFKLAQRLDEFSQTTGPGVETQRPEVGGDGSITLDPDYYPQYRLENNTLIRVGLSGDKTSEYKQNVARSNFNDIVDKIRELAQKDRYFSAESLIKAVKHPSYQVYAVIGFLQERSLLMNPRRGQYELASLERLDAALQRLVWS